MGRISNGNMPDPHVPEIDENVNIAYSRTHNLAVKWCHEPTNTAFAKAPNEWMQIEHNMCDRRAAWSPLWWWSCSLISLGLCRTLASGNYWRWLVTPILIEMSFLKTCHWHIEEWQLTSHWPENSSESVTFIESVSLNYRSVSKK